MELRQRVGLGAREFMPNQEQDEALWEGQRGSGRLSREVCVWGGVNGREEDTTERLSVSRIQQAVMHQAVPKTSVYAMYLMEEQIKQYLFWASPGLWQS